MESFNNLEHTSILAVSLWHQFLKQYMVNDFSIHHAKIEPGRNRTFILEIWVEQDYQRSKDKLFMLNINLTSKSMGSTLARYEQWAHSHYSMKINIINLLPESSLKDTYGIQFNFTFIETIYFSSKYVSL